MSAKHKTPKCKTSFTPQATPLYAAFSNPPYSNDSAETGIIIGWERHTYEEGDRTWTISTPVIVPFGTSGPVFEGDDFWEYVGAAIEVYPTIEEAKAAVPRMTGALLECLHRHEAALAKEQLPN